MEVMLLKMIFKQHLSLLEQSNLLRHHEDLEGYKCMQLHPQALLNSEVLKINDRHSHCISQFGFGQRYYVQSNCVLDGLFLVVSETIDQFLPPQL